MTFQDYINLIGLVIISLIAFKAVTIGSDFSFYYLFKYKRFYWLWYKKRNKFNQSLAKKLASFSPCEFGDILGSREIIGKDVFFNDFIIWLESNLDEDKKINNVTVEGCLVVNIPDCQKVIDYDKLYFFGYKFGERVKIKNNFFCHRYEGEFERPKTKEDK